MVSKGDSGAKESKLHVNSIVAARLLSVIKEVSWVCFRGCSR